MPQLSRAEAQALLQKVLSFSKADGCQATLAAVDGGNLRFARNTVTTSGQVRDMTLAVESNFGRRSSTASTNAFDEASLERVVRRSEELARLTPENPEFVEILGPQEYASPGAFFAATAAISPEFRAGAAAAAIGPARDARCVAAGFLEDSAAVQAIANSKGLFAYHPATEVAFSLTVRTEDGSGSGWAAAEANDAARLDPAATARLALDKAVRSAQPRAIEPGEYTVILEPAAAAGLLQFLVSAFDERRADEGRSFLAKPGGGTRRGERIVDERVTIYSDPTHPEVPAAPFAPDGLPRRRVAWIENGVVKNLHASRYWARRKNAEPIPAPANTVVAGGTQGLEELIASTPRGVLVTRTWYIRMVDPQTVLVTGLTRDGSFFIENGRLAYPIKNMRFNESPLLMLNNLEALGRPQRTGGNLVPPVKVRDFTFSSLSDAV